MRRVTQALAMFERALDNAKQVLHETIEAVDVMRESLCVSVICVLVRRQ